jgi:predicted RNA-binding protein with PUA-like domain
MARKYWLMKSEPSKYAWDALVKDTWTYWDGVRNYEARNNLAAMKKGDLCLYYHSNEGKEVVGLARVKKESYQDPTTDDERWLVVDIEPLKALAEPVSLATIKADSTLSEMQLIRRGRLSVVPVEKAEFDRVLKLGKTKLRGK